MPSVRVRALPRPGSVRRLEMSLTTTFLLALKDQAIPPGRQTHRYHLPRHLSPPLATKCYPRVRQTPPEASRLNSGRRATTVYPRNFSPEQNKIGRILCRPRLLAWTVGGRTAGRRGTRRIFLGIPRKPACPHEHPFQTYRDTSKCWEIDQSGGGVLSRAPALLSAT
jgi:hypothetical protein